MIKTFNAAAVIITFLCTVAYMQNRDIESDEQGAYVKTLERIVDKCTNRGDNPITVDGELWMCGATPTGIKVKENQHDV